MKSLTHPKIHQSAVSLQEPSTSISSCLPITSPCLYRRRLSVLPSPKCISPSDLSSGKPPNSNCHRAIAMPPCAPVHHPRITSGNPKNNSLATRRIIFPRRMFPSVPEIEEISSSSHDAELISTHVTQKSLNVLESGDYDLGESRSPLEQAVPLLLHENENQVLPLYPKSFPTNTPPRRVSLSQRSALGRYQQTLCSNLYNEAPRNQLSRTSSDPSTPPVPILRVSSFECQSRNFNLESLLSESSQFLNHVGLFRPHTPMAAPMRRSQSEPTNAGKSKVQFDPRIWIREFERTPEEQAETWYSCQDMNRFKRHAMALIVAKDRQTSARLLQESCSRAVFTHAALAEESGQTDLDSALQNDRYRAMVAQQEMKRVLIVDPHDICVRLFERAFTTLLPHVEIVGVASAQQAMGQLACQKFDVILVEERLQTTFHLQKRQQSGSDFFRSIGSIAGKTLWIGVSAHLPKDRAALEASNVDFCWHKPPPTMSVDLRNDLLRRLLIKRGHDDFARELFGKS